MGETYEEMGATMKNVVRDCTEGNVMIDGGLFLPFLHMVLVQLHIIVPPCLTRASTLLPAYRVHLND